MDANFEDPYIQKKFRLLLKDIIQEELKNLEFDRKVQGVIVSEPTKDTRTCSIVLNHNMTTLPENPPVINDVPIRSGLNVKVGDEVILTKVNNSNSMFVDYNKYRQATDLITTRRTITSNSALNIHDNIIFISASSNITITLPDSVKCKEKIYVLVRVDNTANTVTVQGVNGQTINGLSSITIGNMSSTSSRQWIYADGSNFFIINKN